MRPKFRLVGNSSLLLISGLASALGLLPHPHVDGYQLKEAEPIESIKSNLFMQCSGSGGTVASWIRIWIRILIIFQICQYISAKKLAF
jgi:hypothetical protein